MTKTVGTTTTLVGAPAQDLPKFQMPCLTPKSVPTYSIHSPDGERKVSLKKIDPFMTNGCHIVAPPDVTSFYWLFTGFCTMFYALKHHNYHPVG